MESQVRTMENRQELLEKLSEEARSIASLTSITARCYDRDKVLFKEYSAREELIGVCDTFHRYLERLDDTEEAIRFITTPYHFCFGILHESGYYLVIGPCRLSAIPYDKLQEAARAAAPSPEYEAAICNYLASVPMSSMHSMLPLLTSTSRMLHYNDSEGPTESTILSNITTLTFLEEYTDQWIQKQVTIGEHFEQLIRDGQVEDLKEWLNGATDLWMVKDVSEDYLRDSKDNFIVLATTAVHAAIQGGLERGYALDSLFKAIRIVENHSTLSAILASQQAFIIDLTSGVKRLMEIPDRSALVNETIHYIQRNLHKPLQVTEIAKAVNVSRGSLSQKFHAETGQTLSDYILEARLREAAQLLVRSRESLASISMHLCFSSQSHFTRAFRKIYGMTPGKYRRMGGMQ